VPTSEHEMHVVFGSGQVGHALVAHLAGLGLPTRVVSRRRPGRLPEGVEWRGADATDVQATIDAAAGATVMYQCLNAPYAKWPEMFPPLQRGVLSAAERLGALLVSLENLYGYGRTSGVPMTEDLPLAATTAKGRTRAVMTAELLAARDAGRVHIAIGRSSDFFGAGVTESSLGERVFANALAGRRADFVGNPDLAHTYSYVPDVAAASQSLALERARSMKYGIWQGQKLSRPDRSLISFRITSGIASRSEQYQSHSCALSVSSIRRFAGLWRWHTSSKSLLYSTPRSFSPNSEPRERHSMSRSRQP